MCDVRRLLRNLLVGAGRITLAPRVVRPRLTPEQRMARAYARLADATNEVRDV